jgi:hypothetical protein
MKPLHKIKKSTKTLDETAMLVRYNCSKWEGRRFDKDVTLAAEAQYKAHDAGRFNKSLLPRKCFKPIERAAGEAYTFHKENTLPWGDKGERVLPAINYFDYTQGMNEKIQAFNSAVEAFIEGYGDAINEAKTSNLGSMFNAEDYPARADLAEKYSLTYKVTPIPTASDFRVPMEKTQLDEVLAKIEQGTSEDYKVALRDPWERLYNEIAHMSERLGAYQKAPEVKLKKGEKRKRGAPKGGTRFNDGMIDSLIDLCDLLPKINIGGDPELNRLAAEAKKKLTKFEGPELRTDNKKRDAVKKQADSILKDMGDFL